MRWNSRYIAWPPRQPLGPGTACWQPVVGHMSESSDYEESGGSNLWPTDSCGSRGSVCVQAQPAGRQRDQESLRRLSYACVAQPRREQVEPGTARPLPFLTRSGGCVLRRIRSYPASFWWSEGDWAVPTEPRDWQLTTTSGKAWVKRKKALS